MNYVVKKNRFLTIVTIVHIGLLSSALGQTDSTFFRDDLPVKIELKADFEKILNNTEEDPDYTGAQLRIYSDEKEAMFDVKLKPRGNFRRDSANCTFPPLRMKVKKSQAENTVFENNENIKIVTHCKTEVPAFEEFIAREYMVYRLYNMVTPISYNVRLAEVTYTDINNYFNPIVKLAFLIEDVDHVGDRNGMKEYEGTVTFKELEHEHALRLAVFQFLIGNTDWVVQMGKNMKILTDGETYYGLPYDFDYTAITGTDYSLGGGHSTLVTPDRIFKGGCYTPEEMDVVLDDFLSMRKEILKKVRKSKIIRYASKDEMILYLDESFSIMNSKSGSETYFFSNCDQ